jgi:hypothetical protein
MGETGETISGLIGIAIIVGAGWYIWTKPTPTAWDLATLEVRAAQTGDKKKMRFERERALCWKAEACKKYDDMRLACAPAGNLKTCLNIKMGSVADYIDMCTGFAPGAPSIPLSPETPNAIQCFFFKLVP